MKPFLPLLLAAGFSLSANGLASAGEQCWARFGGGDESGRAIQVAERVRSVNRGDTISFRTTDTQQEFKDLTVVEPLLVTDAGFQYLLARDSLGVERRLFFHRTDPGSILVTPFVPKQGIRSRFQRDFPVNYPIISQGRKEAGEDGFYLWTVPGKNQDEPAALTFWVDRSEGIIEIEMATGSPKLPGAASYLKSRLAEAYPGYKIRSQFVATNENQLRLAFRDAARSGIPLNQTDFSKVPSIRAVNAPFRIEIQWYSDRATPHFFVEQQVPPPMSAAPAAPNWINANEVLSDPKFLAWIKGLPEIPEDQLLEKKRRFTTGNVKALFQHYPEKRIYP